MFDMIIDSENDQDQNQVLLPISSLFPPNQIISKYYSPDVKPNFRLMQPQKRQKKKVTIRSQNKIDTYSDKFGQNDTLGYQYSKKIKNNLVYLKFNNSSYMKFNIGGINYRFLAGIFIPLQKLLSQQLKKNKNIYKILDNFDYIDNKHPINSSFASNCFSQAPSLKFSSNYQSSNLFAAFQISDSQYDLVLQNDINSKGNTQWFNFTIEVNQEKTYKFNIVNLTKSSSLYQKGMSIVYYSQSNRLCNKQGWMRGCQNINYQRTNVNRQDNANLFYYKLHFQYKSQYKNDVVTFSYCYPYTSLNLEKFFNKIINKKNVNGLRIDKIKIAQTLSGIPIFVYSIAHKRNNFSKTNIMTLQNLDGVSTNVSSVVFMARQHPGQSQSSFITEGIVQWLLQNDYDACKKNFNYYIIPMINADGVFYGNYRTNLSGNDLNRVWKQPRKEYHNEIYCLKKFLYSLNKISQISLIIDIHGHSNAINSFFYGNPQKKQAENPKFFPYFCSKKIRQISYSQSTFSITEDKKCCARVVLGQMFPKALVYTFETSFYGWKRGRTIVQHTIQSYKRLGKQLAHCFIEFSKLIEKNPSIRQKWMKQIQQQVKQIKSEEQIVTDSDEQIQNELIQFRELFQQDKDTSLYQQMNSKTPIKKKITVSIGKNKLLKMIRRHSPIAKNKNHTTFNDNYIMDKQIDSISQSTGFLSIVKINTKSYDSIPFENIKSVEYKRAPQNVLYKHQNTTEDGINYNSQYKENISDKYIKVGKLLNQKQMALSKIKEKRLKIQQQQLHNKKFNGFFKNIYYKKQI